MEGPRSIEELESEWDAMVAAGDVITVDPHSPDAVTTIMEWLKEQDAL